MGKPRIPCFSMVAAFGLVLGLLFDPAGAGAFEEAAAFSLADQETGSTGFTNSNAVDLTEFPVPDGYDRFQFTGRDGEVSAVDPLGWTNAAPAALSFTATAPADEVLLYAWFTNATEQVELLRSEGRIVYTTVAPESAISPVLTRETGGFTLRIEGWQLDNGSTGGAALGEDMDVVALEALFQGGDFPNLTPEAAYLTLTNRPGVYTLGLRVVNEAGNVAEASVPCTMTVTAMDAPPAGDRFVAVGNLLAAHPYNTWSNAAASIQQAVNAVGDGERILIAPGRYTAETDYVIDMGGFNKSLELIGLGGSDAVRVDGEGLRLPLRLTCTVADDFTLRFEDLAFVNGAAAAVGGGVYCQFSGDSAGTLTFAGCEIADNRVTAPAGSAHGGGGLYWDGRATGAPTLVLRGCTVARNAILRNAAAVNYGRGGGLYLRSGTVRIEDSKILDNRTHRESGGLHLQDVNLALRRCEIAGNGWIAPHPNRSGAFEATGASQVLVEESTLRGNRTDGYGGITWLSSGTASVTVRNSLIVGNVGNRAGAFNVENGKLSLQNCTVVGNQATPSTGAGGVRMTGGSTTITNCIIYYNYNSDGVTMANLSGTPDSLVHSCTTGSLPPDSGNIDTPPGFVDPGQGCGETLVPGDYRLASGSPCINTGLNQAWMDGALDLDDRPRRDRVTGTVDMGAYEYPYVGTAILLR